VPAGGVQPRAVAEAAPAVAIDPTAVTAREGYRLLLTPERTAIVAHDRAGAFYAAQTLAQIRRQADLGGEIPCVAIEDWPDFRHRGLMLDVSRTRVPTMERLRALIDRLAEWKLNELQLYVEHTFAYAAHREVWVDASPLTGGEIAELDRYCRERMIELVPNQNSFGHLERWLRHPRYRPLAEAPDGFVDPWGELRPGPFSLCPIEPAAISFLRELYAELLPHFTSRRFNVGCDETFDLGQGRSRAACAERGKGRVYLEFLRAVEREVARHGRTMLFWGDVILNHPELIPELPAGIVALDWGYEADHPFADEAARFAAAGVPFFVCPGTSSWNSIAGRTANACANLERAAAAGRAAGAIGYLVTDWGDNGHWQPPAVSWPGIAWGAAMAWSATANRDLELAPALDRHVFDDAAGVLGRAVYDLGNVYRAGLPLVRNASVLAELLIHPDRGMNEQSFAGLTPGGLAEARAAIDAATGALAAARPRGAPADDGALASAVEELRHAARMLRHAAALGSARLEALRAGARQGEIAAIDAVTRRTLAVELEAIIADYRGLWLRGSRPGGLAESAGRLEQLLARYRQSA
jgi:hypothetical protein